MRDLTVVAVALVVGSIIGSVTLIPAVTGQTNYPGNGWNRGGMGPGMMGSNNEGGTPISSENAQSILGNYLAYFNNQDLAINEFEEYSNNFYGSIVEKSTGRGAFELIIDRYGGILSPEPQGMMWNTKYNLMGMMGGGQGMMGGGYGMMGGSSAYGTSEGMSVTQEQAMERAKDYLNSAFPGTEVSEALSYYGYYTVMVTLNGEHYGMLSVNGYTGAVWYHSWHGEFVSEI